MDTGGGCYFTRNLNPHHHNHYYTMGYEPHSLIFPSLGNGLDSWDMENIRYMMDKTNKVQRRGRLYFPEDEEEGEEAKEVIRSPFSHIPYQRSNQQSSSSSVVADIHLDPYEGSDGGVTTTDASFSYCNEVIGMHANSSSSNTKGNWLDNGRRESIMKHEEESEGCYLLDVMTIGNDKLVIKDNKEREELDHQEDKNCGKRRSTHVPTATIIPRSSSVETNESLSSSSSELLEIATRQGYASSSEYSSTSQDGNNNKSDDDEDGEGFFTAPTTLSSNVSSSFRRLSSLSSSSSSSDSSPYYITLRRDLELMEMMRGRNTPTKTFGVDKQGQLLIDYSQNWEGLELYMKQLHVGGQKEN